MASLTPLAIADCSVAIAEVAAAVGAEPKPERAELLKLLRSLHEILMRVTTGAQQPPLGVLTAATAATRSVADEVVDALSPRPRTVFRLLRLGADQAAWEVLIDNGTGVVAEAYDASTATGAARTSPRLPLLTRIEAGKVYAELPGFRDPRFQAPDECYDITGTIRMKHQVQELVATGTELTVAGWAALDVLAADSNERVSIVMASGEREVVLPARRLRRADLVSGRGDALSRRAWAGFTVVIDLATVDLSVGEWQVWVEINHDGVVVRQPVGRDIGDLAIAGARAPIALKGHTIRWQTTKKHWSVIVK